MSQTPSGKFEIRISKFETFRMFRISDFVLRIFLLFGHLNLFRISDFGFRICFLRTNKQSAQFILSIRAHQCDHHIAHLQLGLTARDDGRVLANHSH